MRLLVTGGSGLLGADLLPTAKARNHEILAPSSSEFDITDPSTSARLADGEWGTFDWVLNLAGYTQVDSAETHPQEIAELNVLGPSYLAAASQTLGARLLHISTDYVFGAAGIAPYREEDQVSPAQKYGESKAEGEAAVLEIGSSVVARVAWLYGCSKQCFPISVIEKLRAGEAPRIVDDQRGVPTWTLEASRMLMDLISADLPPGIYHVAGSDIVSRFEYAVAARASFIGATGCGAPEIVPVHGDEFPTMATRPANSAILTEKALKYTRAHLPLSCAMDAFVAAYLA